MSKKIIVLVLAIASLVIFLPETGNAAVEKERNTPFNNASEYSYANGQIRVRIGQPRRRYYRRVYPRRIYPRRYYRAAPRARYVRQYYYYNGRRYSRLVRVY